MSEMVTVSCEQWRADLNGDTAPLDLRRVILEQVRVVATPPLLTRPQPSLKTVGGVVIRNLRHGHLQTFPQQARTVTRLTSL